ncbi:WD repeat-containing protein 86 isoform X2 [Phalacrocorax carbo]|uniref:WD repeat-containing protein 86 isoform X2 n=1 Tax=Phalacrocorax carbo TaxID=9209 RepID=UPI0031199CED
MGNSGSAVKVCTDHQGGINWLSLSPDGQRLLTGSEDGTARLWSTADSQCHGHFQGHESYITFCHLENEAAFTCSADHTIRKWDVMTGQCLAIYRGHTSIVNRILVAKDYLFSGSYDRTARCWSVDKEKQIQEFRGHRNCVLTLAHYSSRDVLEEEEEEEEEEEKVSRDLLVTGSTDCTVKVWWVSSGRCYQTLLGHTGAVLCLILDAPNRELFSGSTDYTIRTWNIVTGEQLKVFKEHQGSVICLEYFLVNAARFVNDTEERRRLGAVLHCPPENANGISKEGCMMVCNLLSGQQTLNVCNCMCLTEVNDNNFSHYSPCLSLSSISFPLQRQQHVFLIAV